MKIWFCCEGELMNKGKLLKAYPFLEEVDGCSLEVALAIYKIRPHWISLGKVGEFKGDKFLSIEFQSPKHSDWRIFFNTAQCDVTVVYYHSFHVHFNIGRPSLESALRESFEFIDELMREKWVIAYKLLDNGLEYGHAYAVDEISNMNPDVVHYIRSWRGTFDKNLLEA
jgi:hypothetical protein